ncbi:MAG: hypothetical protein ABIO72_01300 [Patescibacteria group bacterium]
MDATKIEPFKSIIGESKPKPPVLIDVDSLIDKDLSKQVATIEKWAKNHEVHITKEQLLEAAARLPSWPMTKRTILPVLVPYCESRAMFSATVNTIRTLWSGVHDALGLSRMREKPYRSPDVIREPRVMNKFEMDKFELLPGIESFIGLRWEMIDAFANINVAPKIVRSPQTSPHAGVIAIAMHYPKLAKELGSEQLPNLAIGGYIRKMGSGVPDHVLVLNRDPHFANPTLILRPEDAHSEILAVPEFYVP